MRGLAKFFSTGDGRPLPRLPMERQPMTQPTQEKQLVRDISVKATTLSNKIKKSEFTQGS